MTLDILAYALVCLVGVPCIFLTLFHLSKTLGVIIYVIIGTAKEGEVKLHTDVILRRGFVTGGCILLAILSVGPLFFRLGWWQGMAWF